jgi:hypothetical protein
LVRRSEVEKHMDVLFHQPDSAGAVNRTTPAPRVRPIRLLHAIFPEEHPTP